MSEDVVNLWEILDKVSDILMSVWTPVILATLGFSMLYLFIIRK